jgi:hypothetical protein
MKTEVYTDLEIKEFAAIGENLIPESSYMADWVFHYNPYNNLWNAIPRDVYNEYWSNSQHHAILKSKHLNTLLDMLHRTKGDVGMIEDLTRGEIR